MLGAGPGPCLPVLPQVQGEGVPLGLQDITHTLWVQALSQENGGVQGEGSGPGHTHLKPGGEGSSAGQGCSPRPGNPSLKGSQRTWGLLSIRLVKDAGMY